MQTYASQDDVHQRYSIDIGERAWAVYAYRPRWVVFGGVVGVRPDIDGAIWTAHRELRALGRTARRLAGDVERVMAEFLGAIEQAIERLNVETPSRKRTTSLGARTPGMPPLGSR